MNAKVKAGIALAKEHFSMNRRYLKYLGIGSAIAVVASQLLKRDPDTASFAMDFFSKPVIVDGHIAEMMRNIEKRVHLDECCACRVGLTPDGLRKVWLTFDGGEDSAEESLYKDLGLIRKTRPEDTIQNDSVSGLKLADFDALHLARANPTPPLAATNPNDDSTKGVSSYVIHGTRREIALLQIKTTNPAQSVIAIPRHALLTMGLCALGYDGAEVQAVNGHVQCVTRQNIEAMSQRSPTSDGRKYTVTVPATETRMPKFGSDRIAKEWRG